MARNPGGAPISKLSTLRSMQSAPLNLPEESDADDATTVGARAATVVAARADDVVAPAGTGSAGEGGASTPPAQAAEQGAPTVAARRIEAPSSGPLSAGRAALQSPSEQNTTARRETPSPGPTSALGLLNVPPPPRKSLANRVGTRGAPYTRRDGKKTLKLQAAISEETFELLDRYAKSLPQHVKYNDFVDMIVRDGIAKFEKDLQDSASANLQIRRG